MNIDLSIIVCVYDDKRVMRCIRSIISQDFGNLLWEVLVIENGSNKFDRLSKEKNTRYLQQREKNMAKARSLGVKNSHGKYCLFTDADCVVDRHWSKNMYDMLSKDDNACAGGRIMRYDPKTKTEVFGRNLAWGQTTLQHYLPMINYPYVVFANAGFSRAILLDVGPFDEVLLSGNDVDICWRLHKKGYKFLINDAAKVWHENRKSVKDYFTTFFRYSVYQVLLFHKYLSDIREFKKKKKKIIIVNTYPPKLLAISLIGIVISPFGKNRKRDFFTNYYNIVESIAEIIGTIWGALKFWKLPIY